MRWSILPFLLLPLFCFGQQASQGVSQQPKLKQLGGKSFTVIGGDTIEIQIADTSSNGDFIRFFTADNDADPRQPGGGVNALGRTPGIQFHDDLVGENAYIYDVFGSLRLESENTVLHGVAGPNNTSISVSPTTGVILKSGGSRELRFDDSGFTLTEGTGIANGFRYGGNYRNRLLLDDFAIPDLGLVKLLIGDSLEAIGGGTPPTLSLIGNELSISGGNTVTLPDFSSPSDDYDGLLTARPQTAAIRNKLLAGEVGRIFLPGDSRYELPPTPTAFTYDCAERYGVNGVSFSLGRSVGISAPPVTFFSTPLVEGSSEDYSEDNNSTNAALATNGLCHTLSVEEEYHVFSTVDTLSHYSSVRVYYRKNQITAGTLRFTIDGTVYDRPLTLAGSGRAVDFVEVTGLTYGTHQLVLRALNNSITLYELVVTRAVSKGGVQVFLSGNANMEPEEQQDLIGNDYLMDDYPVDLSFVRIGVNGLRNNDAAGTAAATIAIVNDLESHSGGIVIVGETDNNLGDSRGDEELIGIYNSMLDTFSRKNDHVFIDMARNYIPDWTEFTDLFPGDNIHEGTEGGKYISQIFLSELSIIDDTPIRDLNLPDFQPTAPGDDFDKVAIVTRAGNSATTTQVNSAAQQTYGYRLFGGNLFRHWLASYHGGDNPGLTWYLHDGGGGANTSLSARGEEIGLSLRHNKSSGESRMGIGVLTPSEALEVNGDAKISGLAGDGIRMVTADPDGKLISQAIPDGNGGGSSSDGGRRVAMYGAGQSNMDGRRPFDPADADPRIKVWDEANGGLVAPESYFTNTNPLVHAAKAYLVDHPADTVVLIHVAQGGATISRWYEGGDLRTRATGVLNAAFSAGAFEKIEFAAWHQGESDAAGQGINTNATISEAQENYRTAWDSVYTLDLALPYIDENTYYALGEVLYTEVVNAPYNDNVNQAIRKIGSGTYDNVGFASAEGLTSFDALHLDYDSYVTMGKRMYSGWKSLPNRQEVTVRRIERDGTDLVITYTDGEIDLVSVAQEVPITYTLDNETLGQSPSWIIPVNSDYTVAEIAGERRIQCDNSTLGGTFPVNGGKVAQLANATTAEPQKVSFTLHRTAAQSAPREGVYHRAQTSGGGILFQINATSVRVYSGMTGISLDYNVSYSWPADQDIRVETETTETSVILTIDGIELINSPMPANVPTSGPIYLASRFNAPHSAYISEIVLEPAP